MTETYCEVCGHLLVRPRNGGALCAACRTAGALFRRRWMGDLGATWRLRFDPATAAYISGRLAIASGVTFG